jgi:hypothetical protein
MLGEEVGDEQEQVASTCTGCNAGSWVQQLPRLGSARVCSCTLAGAATKWYPEHATSRQAGIITLQCAMDCLRDNKLTVCLCHGSLITRITLQLGLSEVSLQLAHRQDEELALLAGVAVAAAAGIPA